MARSWLPSFGRKDAAPLEVKDAATQRASAGSRGGTYAGQPYTAPGVNVDRLVRDGYEKVIWAFKAVDAIADKMSGWPITCMEGQEPDWKQVEDDILPLLNSYSNEIERTAKYFRYRLVSQLLLSKRGVFVEAIPSRVGTKVAALNLLPPGMTQPIPDPDKFLKGFRVDLPNEAEPLNLPVYDPDKKAGVIWIRKPHPTDPYSSVTPLEAAGISLDLDFYARMYNRNFLLNDGRAGQIVAVKGGLSTEDALELKARFTPGMNGAGRTTVIEADAINVTDTATTPRDAQYAELRSLTKEDLLIALGTPESVIGNASGRTFDNADAEKENWLDVTVLPLSQVVESGFDPLTAGGWGDDRRIKHDVSGEPVLRRRHDLKVKQAAADFAAGLITLDEYRDIAELEPIKRPGSRVVWIPGGKVAVGADEADEQAAAELKPVGAPADPNAAGGADLSAMLPGEAGGGGGGPFDLGGAIGTPQDQAQALTTAAAALGLELKAFNPNQPRYPQGHPKGGQFMDAGDIALWLAGKPLKGGFSSAGVVDPNKGSTAAAAVSPGIHGGASRFTSHPNPAVRAAAAVVTYPQNYPHPRVLGAPPAKDLATHKATKVVSLRRGDVVMYKGTEHAVSGAKRTKSGGIELELVDNQGNVATVTALPSDTLLAVARTPHPTVVAQAKRDIAAAANAPAAPTPVGPHAAPVVPVTPPPGAGPVVAASPQVRHTPVVGATGPFTVPGVGRYQHTNGAWLTVRPDGTGEYLAPGAPTSTTLTAGQVAVHLQGTAGSGWTMRRTGGAHAATAAQPATPVAPLVYNPGVYTIPGGQVQVRPDGSGILHPLGGGASTPMPRVQTEAMLMTHGVKPNGPGAPAAPAAAPSSGPAAPSPAAGPVYNLPPAPPGTSVYVHPQGKVIYVSPGGQVTAYKPNGAKASTSATAQKLAVGHGQWRLVSAPPTGPAPSSRAKSAQAAAVPATPAPAAATPGPVPGAAIPPTPPLPTPQSAAVPATPPNAVVRSTAADRVIADGVPTSSVGAGWRTTGGQAGSNPAAMMTDPTGGRHYVKSLDAKHADNEVAAARIYRAAGVQVPVVARAQIAAGSFPGQTHNEGIDSKVIAGTPDMSTRMQRDATYRDAVLADFAVHAWLGNWDAVENNNTQTAPDGRPVTIDVGGSMMFRARGGARKIGGTGAGAFGDKVDELTSMRTGRTAGGSARAAFSQLKPDHTDSRFVAGVERIAAITPDQLRTLVDTSYPSFSQKERDQLHETLLKRREHLAGLARVDLPEKKQAGGGAPGPSATAPAPAGPRTPAAPNAPAAGPTPAAPAAPSSPQVAAAAAILTPPSNYPYPVVQGAPVASALRAPKPIKVASLRKGDVIREGGPDPLTVISVDRASGDIRVMNKAGQTVTLHGSNHPSGNVLAIARTPHPTQVAQARRTLAGAGTAPGTAGTPSPQAANVVRTTPAFSSHVQAMSAARNFGTAQQGGYAPVPGQTYATPLGDMVVVHSDGSGDFIPSVQTPGLPAHRPMSPQQISIMLDQGTTYVPVGPRILTSKYSLEVGRHGNQVGDYVDVRPDGTGTLHLAATGNDVQLNEDGVESLLRPPTPAQPSHAFVSQGPSPAVRSGPAPAAAAPAASSYVGQLAPAGGWGATGQIVPGAVFTSGTGPNATTLTIGPRGGGKITRQGQSSNMSAASAHAALNRRGNQYRLTTPGPSALVNAPAPAAAATPAAPAAPVAPAAPAGPAFASKVGRAAATVVADGLQDGQVFHTNRAGGQTITLRHGRGELTDASGATKFLSMAQVQRTLKGKTTGWVAKSGPDIDQPGPQHAAAVRRAQRAAGVPAPGTPVLGTPPVGAVYPQAAVGAVTPMTLGDLSRGHTVRVGGQDWIVTEVAQQPGSRRYDVWGYRPGIDDPNTVVQERAGGPWRQGSVIPTISGRGKTQSVDVVGPAAQPAQNVPSAGTARPFDPALPTVTVRGVGASVKATPFDVNQQMVKADKLKAGDVITLRGREAEGQFVVTGIQNDHKGRPAVFGYNGTALDESVPGATNTPQRLFLVGPSGTVRDVGVQVHGATPALPQVPKPTPPQGASGIERNPISDPTSVQRVKDIMSGRVRGTAPGTTTKGDSKMGHLMAMRGYNAHPDVVSEAELDAYIDDGEIELWRGMTGTSHSLDLAEAYRSGTHYPGGASANMFGTGAYASYGVAAQASSPGNPFHGDASGVAFSRSTYASGGSGVMIRMSLKSDARVAEFEALKKAMRASTEPEVRQMAQMGDAGVGHFAVYMGYDAIKVGNAYRHGGYGGGGKHAAADDWGAGFMVVLNRSAVRVSSKNYVPNSQLGSAPAGQDPPPLSMSNARPRHPRGAKHQGQTDARTVTKEP